MAFLPLIGDIPELNSEARVRVEIALLEIDSREHSGCYWIPDLSGGRGSANRILMYSDIFDAFAEQGGRAELFAVRRGAVPITVLQSAPEAGIGEEAATPPEKVLDQRDPPSEAEIAGIGIACRVEGTAEMGPRRPDHAKEFRRGEQHFEIDVRSRFDVLVEQSDVMGEDAKLELVDHLGLRSGRDSGRSS